MLPGYINVWAECGTTDGRKVGAMLSPVLPELRDDEPAFRAVVLDVLKRAAAEGDPPGELDETALAISFPEPLL